MFVLFAATFQGLNACDICGCSLNNGFSSILPQYQKSFLGLRGSVMNFEATHADQGGKKVFQNSTSVELFGRCYLHRRVQMVVSLPYNIKLQKESGAITSTRALGDAMVNFNYLLIDKRKDSMRWKHLLLLGGGIKLPTGKNNVQNTGDLVNQAMQPGSGSIDYILTTSYIIRHREFGLINDFQYRFNTENTNKYAFGNKLTAGSRCFYWKRLGRNSQVMPSGGVLLENMQSDYLNGYKQAYTGGQMISASAGFEYYYKDVFISSQYLYPLKQSLGGGLLKAMPRLQITACYMF